MAASQGSLDVAIIGGGIAGLYCLYRREFEKAADDDQAIYKCGGETNSKRVPARGNSKSVYGIALSNSPGITNITTFRPIGCWLAESQTGGRTHLEERRMVGSPLNDRGNTSIIWQRFQLPAAATGRTDYMFAGKRFRTIRDS